MSTNETDIENEIEAHPESYMDDSDADFYQFSIRIPSQMMN